MILRPAIVWTLFLASALAVVAALALLTRHAGTLEQTGRASVAEADLATRTRLALWRMDSSASSLLAVENNRPPSQFSAFPGDRGSRDTPPSPLLKEIPDYARLHFQVDENGNWSSPQVPQDFSRALSYGISEARLLESADLLKTIQDRIPSVQLLSSRNSENAESRREEGRAVPAPSAPRDRSIADVPDELKRSDESLARDQLQRKEIVGKATRRGEFAQNIQPAQEMAEKADTSAGTATASASVGSFDDSRSKQMTSDLSELPATRLASEPTGLGSASSSSSYRAIWIGRELFLCRDVVQDGRTMVQGVWLNVAELSESLLAAARDVLPTAQLVASEPSESGPLGLVTLPYRLIPGTPPSVDPALLPQPVQGFVRLAWAACLLLLLVAAFLIAGVLQLGERRATFVSSVTHELRTPLTTFRLYAEMLAGKMVPDEARRQEYLETLRGEAERLSHLVENVLAYSRIERGSARSKLESIPVGDLLERILPRLAERAGGCGMQIVTRIPPEVASQVLRTDPTAVEQILFNLTDNACKYGIPESAPAILELSASQRPGRRPEILLAVRDHGPGIPRQEQRRLFRPFHKSASEAAHSQPGVGLGLALSRRLARALGGDLRYQSATPGTEFSLTLPVQAADW